MLAGRHRLPYIYNYVTRQEESVGVDFCRVKNYLSNDNTYVKLRSLLTKLQAFEDSTVKKHNNTEMAN